MEEDIKILDEQLKQLREENNKTIENLLTRYKQLEEDNKELRKYYATRKEVEDLKETISCLHESDKDYIPKSKIKEKIEELKIKLKDVSKRREKAKAKEEKNILWCLEIRLDEKIKTLQELLEEE